MSDAIDVRDYHEDDKLFLAKKWKGVELASWEAVQKAADGQATAFVWPDEGAFKGATWRFNADHEGFEPLLIDKVSAGMIVLLHNTLQEEKNRQKVRDWISKHRGLFAKIWEITQERVTITGFRSA